MMTYERLIFRPLVVSKYSHVEPDRSQGEQRGRVGSHLVLRWNEHTGQLLYSRKPARLFWGKRKRRGIRLPADSGSKPSECVRCDATSRHSRMGRRGSWEVGAGSAGVWERPKPSLAGRHRRHPSNPAYVVTIGLWDRGGQWRGASFDHKAPLASSSPDFYARGRLQGKP